MKKIVLLLSLTVIFSGCTKQYSSIDKYNEDMQTVRNSFPAYTLEVSQTIPNYNLKYKSYVKDDKWVTEVSKDNGVSNFVTLVSSGKDLCYYSKDSEFAILLPVEKLLIDKTRENKSDKIWMLNPIANLFYWTDGRGIFDSLNLIANDVDTNRKKYDVGTSQAKISKNLTKMNGFDCRMITFGNNEFGREACISEKYGIAVYSKLKTKNSKNNSIEITTNVTSIDVNDIPNSLVNLPKDKSKITRRELETHMAITNQDEDETKQNSSELASEYYDKKDFETANRIRENQKQAEKLQEIDAEKYYCPSEDGRYDSSTDIYKPKDDCSAWNNDFFKKSDPEIYTRCLTNKQKAKQKYEQGLCTPIVKKEHKFGSVNCTVEVAEKYNEIISKSCQNDASCMKTNSCATNLNPYMKKIDEMYK